MGLHLNNALHELYTTKLDWVGKCVPSAQDVLLDCGHVLPGCRVLRVINAVMGCVLAAAGPIPTSTSPRSHRLRLAADIYESSPERTEAQALV